MPRRRTTDSRKLKNIIDARRKRKIENQRHRRHKKRNPVKITQTTSQRVKKHRSIREEIEIAKNDNRTEHYLGPMNTLCSCCEARHFKGEIVSGKNSFNDCCSHGAVAAASFTTFPKKLRSLFDRNHEYSTEFLNDIRGYNTSLSFASFNAHLTNFDGKRPGPYCFKIRGHIYYQINTALYPEPDQSASFGQLFILDPSIANKQRLNYNSGLHNTILKILDKIMRKHNSFAKSYHMMKEEIRRLEKKKKKTGQAMPEVTMTFIPRHGLDARRYNPQRANEVAAIFTTTADGNIPDTYVTIRSQNKNELRYVSSMDPRVEPWIYPLFYPCGEYGWHKDLFRLRSQKRISRSAYVKNLIAVRDSFNPFLCGGRLFQQWIVDNYVKIERDRIQFCRTHQKESRSESYQGVIDFMQSQAENTRAQVGRMIILPSTFIGSPRTMAQNYQDAMAIVRKHGKPDLFVTMTCNPNWREIRENLLVGQQPCDRPDIVARVFSLKVNALLNMITKGNIFGRVQAYVYVIEFQKRGLPHVHMLVTLKRNYKITCPDVVDMFISAEIPDSEKKPKLFQVVMQNMIHGPCGDWCLKNGNCSKKFPKPYNQETTMDEDGYPLYRRRDTGVYHERPNGYIVDNRLVVPYSPKLLYKFKCHCNVEIVSSIKAVKYLFKYIYKGHDAATVTINGTAANMTEVVHDEIKEHIEARYVGPVEACWRILSKKLQKKSHSIVRLPVHLPNQHNVTRNPGAETITLDDIVGQKTMLIDYFALNARDKDAWKYLYADIPTYYSFQKKTVGNKIVRRWMRRKTSFHTIGRIYSVSPAQVELFHLRVLLSAVKAATSFEDLRTVDGQLQPSFTAACLAMGLIADDQEWSRAMHEAEVWMMPLQLRRLFVRILLHCHPLHPEELWHEFKDAMSEDFVRNMTIVGAQSTTLNQIHQFFANEGKNLTDYLTIPQIEITHNIENETDQAAILQAGMENYIKLNNDQKEIINTILNCVDNPTVDSYKTFYIDGPGGSGKTFLYTTLWHLLIGNGKKVIAMAYTGIAATLLPSGRTVHKTFGLAVPLYPDSTSSIKNRTKEANKLIETDVFIWDEAPMAPRYALENMDRLLRDLMTNDAPFGGKIVVLGGDFRQLLPINVGGTRGETVNLSIKNSSLWRYFQKYQLTKNMRTLPEEKEFTNFLLQIEDGTLNDDEDNICLPEYCINDEDINIATDIYETLIRNREFKKAAKCAILTARNIDVNEINQQVVKLLDISNERIYTSVDSAEKCNEDDEINLDLVPEYLNTLSPACLPPHELRLRPFSIVMLIRNLSLNEGLCNGTRLSILELGTNVLRCEILTGDKTGQQAFLHRITVTCENVYPFTFSRRQFPIKLAFALTINKSQGQTFDKIGIDLRKDIFNHGQLYVALSRVRAWNSLKIYLGSQRNRNKVKNYVFKELFN